MAWFERAGVSRRHTLAARSLVGRAANCLLRPSDRRVSGEHATIIWTAERWEIRDLGSRNGTFVNGRRIDVGISTGLVAGDTVGFGGADDVWTFADAGPPVATARSLDDDEMQLAQDGLLVLPSPDEPRVSIFDDLQGGWQAELEGESRAVRDGEVLTVAGRAWTLHLPIALERTVDVDGQAPLFEMLTLSFAVSSDEEHVEMSVIHDGHRRPLSARTHHFLLLLLARARLEDAGQPDLPAAEHGWRYVEDVCRMLQVDDLRLNTEIYRARKELSALGIQGAPRLVERRRSSRNLRLGTAAAEVEPAR